MQRQRIQITFDGRAATTVDLSAAEHGMNHDAMAKVIARAKIKPFPDRIGRIPLYPDAEVRAALRDRPGKGSPGQARPDRALAVLRTHGDSAPAVPPSE